MKTLPHKLYSLKIINKIKRGEGKRVRMTSYNNFKHNFGKIIQIVDKINAFEFGSNSTLQNQLVR